MTRKLSVGQALQGPVCGTCGFGGTGKNGQPWLSGDAFWGDLMGSVSLEGYHLLTRVGQNWERSSATLPAHPKGLAHTCPL